MKNFILTLFTAFFAFSTLAQENPIGPLPYQKLETLVGQTFAPITHRKLGGKDWGFMFLKRDGDTTTLYNKDIASKKFQLISLTYKIDDREYALLQDSVGAKYVCTIVENILPDLYLTSEMEAAKKMYLGKTLWVNHKVLYINEENDPDNILIKDIRFEPVIVIDIIAGNSEIRPLKFILKTAKGQTGMLMVTLSGTNTGREKEQYYFNNNFFTQNPKLKYKFDAKTWSYLKSYLAEKGMTADAVILAEGHPQSRNKGAILDQWVYDWGYVYFRDGKVQSIDYKK